VSDEERKLTASGAWRSGNFHSLYIEVNREGKAVLHIYKRGWKRHYECQFADYTKAVKRIISDETIREQG